MELAKAVEHILFPTNVAFFGGLTVIFYLFNSVYFFNNLSLFLLTFIIYVIGRKALKGRIKSESRKFATPAFIGLLSFLVLSYFFPVDRLLIFAFVSIVVANALIYFLRVRWKISAHSMTFVGLVTILSIVDIRFISLSLLLPIVIWSRLKLKRHTIPQIIAGSILGFVIPVLIFMIMAGL